MTKNQARLQFVQWVKDNFPGLYAQALDNAESWRVEQAQQQGNPGTISGLGAEGETTTFFQKFLDNLATLGTAVVGYKTQQQILDANIERAKQGLEPLDMSTGAPVVKTQIELSPDVIARMQETAMEGSKGLLKIAAIIGGGFLIMKLAGKRR